MEEDSKFKEIIATDEQGGAAGEQKIAERLPQNLREEHTRAEIGKIKSLSSLQKRCMGAVEECAPYVVRFLLLIITALALSLLALWGKYIFLLWQNPAEISLFLGKVYSFLAGVVGTCAFLYLNQKRQKSEPSYKDR